MAKTARSEAKKISDQLRNIRRRYERAAARAMKLADQAESPTERSKHLASAETFRTEARKYYVSNITEKKARTSGYTSELREAATTGEKRSAKILRTPRDRNRAAKNILKGNVGAQFYAATVSLWQNEPTERRDEAILSKTGYPDLLSLMEAMSDATGKDYFEDSSTEDAERYDVLTVRTGMLFVRENF